MTHEFITVDEMAETLKVPKSCCIPAPLLNPIVFCLL